VAEDWAIFGDQVVLSIMEGGFRYCGAGQIAAGSKQPRGMRVGKIERAAGTEGGLSGNTSAGGVKESCFNWEGKGEECENHTDIPFPDGAAGHQPVLQGEKLRLWKGI